MKATRRIVKGIMKDINRKKTKGGVMMNELWSLRSRKLEEIHLHHCHCF